MAARLRPGYRAERIYEYLKTNLNKPHRIGDLLAALELQDGDRTRSAIRKARELAEADGLHFPVACPANGYTYVVTDDPTAALDPALHLARIAQGVDATKQVGIDFMRHRMKQMDPAVRPVAASYLAVEQHLATLVSGAYDLMGELVKATVDSRREARRP